MARAQGVNDGGQVVGYALFALAQSFIATHSVPWNRLFTVTAPLRDHPRFQALLEKYADDVED